MLPLISNPHSSIPAGTLIPAPRCHSPHPAPSLAMGSYPIHCYARPPNDIPAGPGPSQLSPWSLLLDWGFILSCVLPLHALFWAHCVGQFPSTPQARLALLLKCLLIPYVLLLPLPSPCLVHTHPDILPFFCLNGGPDRHFS